jgi:hypothetical protein
VIFITPFPKENQNVDTFEQRLQRCDREIAAAIDESGRPHTEAEHVGILLWEMDWRAEWDRLLAEITVQKAVA